MIEKVYDLLKLVSVDILQVDAVGVCEALVLITLTRFSLLEHLHYSGDDFIFLDLGG